MWGVATLHVKQYGEYRLSAMNDSGESIQNRDYLFEFEIKLKTFRYRVSEKTQRHKISLGPLTLFDFCV